MRNFIKITMRYLCILMVSPILILNLISTVAFKHSLFASFSQILSLVPGTLGSYLRIAFYRFSMTNCHSEIVIYFSTLFSQPDTEIEQGVYIGPQCNIGSCVIGKNTLIASGVHIMSGKNQHRFSTLQVPIQQQGGTYQKITIGEDCWIGNCALVMANIGNHCIVGAGAVVTEDVSDYSIVVGNPAKVIKIREH